MKLSRLFSPFSPRYYRRRVFAQLWMLSVQFLLGMLLNLVGPNTTGALHHVYFALLVLHIINAIGLVEGSLYIALKLRTRLGWWSAFAVGATFLSGILTVATGQSLWSFAMSVGFIASAWLYVVALDKGDRQITGKL